MRKLYGTEKTQALKVISKAFSDYPLYVYFFGNDPEKTEKRGYCFISFEAARYPDSLYTDENGAVFLFVKKDDRKAVPGMRLIFDLILKTGVLCLLKAVKYALFAEKIARKLDLKGNHLIFLAVKEEDRGKGYAGKVLEELANCGDYYLETHNIKNVEMYQHKGGRLISDVRFVKNLDHYTIVFGGNK